MFRRAFWRMGIAGLEGDQVSTYVKVLARDSNSNILLFVGAYGQLPSAVAGYAVGCMAICGNSGTGQGYIYFNTGTTSSCTFTIQGTLSAASVTAANIALADGKILAGTGSAVAVTPSGDLTMSNTGVFTIGAGKVLPANMGVKIPITMATYVATGASYLPAAADILGGYIVITASETGGFYIHLPSAASIQAALNATVGSWFDIDIVNASGQTGTVSGATGVTIKGTAAITNNKAARIRLINTGSNTIDAVIIQS